MGLREGSTEVTRVVRSLLADLIERGLDSQRMRLWVIGPLIAAGPAAAAHIVDFLVPVRCRR